VPVATVALNGAKNAGILAVQIIGVADQNVSDKLTIYKQTLSDKVTEMTNQLKQTNA
jgi:5-(carboxyamino)imidazole ribonucleotide mutase